MSKDVTFEEIARALEPAQTVLVASHVRPDGDALGSTIAFALWLKSLGKDVTAWNEDGMLDKFLGSGRYSRPSRSPKSSSISITTSATGNSARSTTSIAVRRRPGRSFTSS